MRHHVLTVLVSAVLAAGGGCDEPFSPRADFHRSMVVFSIIHTGSDTQFVRVHTTYDPPSFDPATQTEDLPVTGAQVTITGGARAATFTDTLVERSDTSRYTSAVRAYVVSNFRPVAGESYQLTVTSPTLGTAQATTVIPSEGNVSVSGAYILNAPESYEDQNIILDLSLSSAARGFRVQFFVHFDYLDGGIRVPGKREVPLQIVGSSRRFPAIARAATNVTMVYQNQAYRQVLDEIRAMYFPADVEFRQAQFLLTQLDLHLYSYYKIANGFEDEFTIRADEPDYSNIQGGIGVFGSYHETIRTFNLPAQIPFQAGRHY